ncbi:hypothetical protein SLEP1_g13908 [Rubroshorea leprosula]|uniref:Uncharacterized protein n=1 Tax=Rubroshorea leprosula TaxID=152421 RepID=A0AAV5IHF9_9ROSI|nr:hypothetical protein SLEP1_g13908 [Rubroshorea leprosula]
MEPTMCSELRWPPWPVDSVAPLIRQLSFSFGSLLGWGFCLFAIFCSVRSSFSGKTAPNWKFFGVPLVARISDLSNGYNICYHFLKLLNPLLLPTKDVVNDFDGDDGAMGTSGNKTSKMEDVVGPSVLDSGADPVSVTEDDSHEGDNFKFYLVENMASTEMKMNEPVLIPGFKKKFGCACSLAG